MTLEDFRDILLLADPEATHYFKLGGGQNYTTWHEFAADIHSADDREDERVWHVQVDRFTKIEYDPMVQAIEETLDRDDLFWSYRVTQETDTGYIHHIWTVEAV